MVHIVRATREGLFGAQTAVGLRITPGAVFVALPSTRALWKIVRVEHNGLACLAPVLDVGPWNEHDEAYVFGTERPQAESGRDTRLRPTNRAGIDLSDGVLRALAIVDFRPGQWEVAWEFMGPMEPFSVSG